jgi:hypothetical protein
MHLTGGNPYAPKYRPAFARARGLPLRKALQNLNPDFLRYRAFDPSHVVPEPDDLPLLLDVHLVTSEE